MAKPQEITTKLKCSEKGCENPHSHKGYCFDHLKKKGLVGKVKKPRRQRLSYEFN